MRRVRGAICPHVWRFTPLRFEFPAGGNFVATNAECEHCHKRIWAHGRWAA